MNTKRNELFYGLGITNQTIFDTIVGSFLMLYATDILGLDALSFASLLIIPKVVDVLIDFFIMYFVGKTKTKYGMYRPWLLSAIGTVICLVIIFSIKYFNISERNTLIVIFIAYFMSEAIFTSLYWIPYSAIPGVISEDSNELVRLSSSLTRFDYLSSTLVNILMMPILLAFGGYKDPKGWLIAVIIFSLIGLVCSLLCFFFVKTDLKLEEKNKNNYSIKDIFTDYRYIITNKYFLGLAIILILVYLAVYINLTVSYYFYIYNLGIEDKIAYLAIFAAIFAIIASILTNKIKEIFDYKKTIIIGAINLGLSGLLMMNTYSFAMMIFTGFFQVTGTVILTTIIFSLWPTISKKLNNNKIKAAYNNTMSLSNVLGSLGIIVANTIGAGIISFSKYNPSLLTQSEYTLKVLRYSSPTITVVMSLMIFLIMLFKKKND